MIESDFKIAFLIKLYSRYLAIDVTRPAIFVVFLRCRTVFVFEKMTHFGGRYRFARLIVRFPAFIQ